MISPRPIVITLLLAASAGGARAADQTADGLEACINSARQADATCSKLIDDPARRLDCFQHARDEQLACLQRALPDPAMTTSRDGDRDAQPREAAPKAVTSDASSQPTQKEKTQTKAPDTPRTDRPAQDNAQATSQAGAQQTAKKEPDAKNAPGGAASNVAAPPAGSTTNDAPADTASISKNSPPAPQPPASAAVESAPAGHQAGAVSEPKPPAKTDAPAAATSITTNAPPATSAPSTPSVENPAPSQQAGAVSEPKTAAKDTIKDSAQDPTKDTVKPAAKADMPADTTSVIANTPPAAPQVESPPPARQAGTVSEPKTVAKDSTKDSIKDSAAASVKTPAKADAPAAKQPESNWVVSEMTSPIDYRPLLTAVVHPTSSSAGGPTSLVIRCVGGQTGLSIYTDGAWHAPRKNTLPVDHQIDDQSAVRQMWTLSADAKSATYVGDTVALLRSFPEGTRLTINVPDGASAKHDATFLLTGWETIRKRIGTTCKWPKPDAQASSGR